MNYAEVIVPVPLRQTFTYHVPDEMAGRAAIGMRVVVPFGAQRRYIGIIVRLTGQAPVGYEIKDVDTMPDDRPLVIDTQLTLWQWIAHYYLCAVGDVMHAALPTLIGSVGKKTGGREGTQSKRLSVRICAFDDDAPSSAANPAGRDLRTAFDTIGRSPRQMSLFMKLLDMSHAMQQATPDLVDRDALLKAAGASADTLRALAQKGLLSIVATPPQPTPTLETTRTEPSIPQPQPAPLSPAQTEALRQIQDAHRQHTVCLLHGVTSSGKTEIYVHLMLEVLAQGRRALMLVPEIALTAQLRSRMARVFGGRLAVYHSGLSDQERATLWRQLATEAPDAPQVILGARSAVLLPLTRLGLVVVDEEHEPSFKQQDPAPRYHGRDVAIYLAQQAGAKVVLGSATPSLESYYQAQQGRYGYVALTQRHGNAPVPQIQLVPIQKARAEGTMQGPFTPTMLAAINHTLNGGGRAIIFQNRRGYAAQIECTACGWTPVCPRCDVPLTVHKRTRALNCHYCGYTQGWPVQCPECGSPKMSVMGFGTERIEETLARLLPDAHPVRMDTDTTTSLKALRDIIGQFERREARVLIGTQMVAKGLDFDDIGVVGILDAEQMMNQPDFRAHERAFQLMEQVGGRASRRAGDAGEVLIQCRASSARLLSHVLHHDYTAMAETELADRQRYGYPPFTRLIVIRLKGRYEDSTRLAATALADRLRQTFGARVLGPEAPAISRVKNLYIFHILLKIERSAPVTMARDLLLQAEMQWLNASPTHRQVGLHYDVDPM